MLPFLAWLQASPLGVFMRDSSAWTYAVTNLVHLLGIGSLFGAVLILDLRLLGVKAQVPLASLAATAAPVAAAGFVVAATSGLCLLSANATEYAANPFLLIKFPAIAVGFANAVAIRRSGAWRAIGARDLTPGEQQRLKAMAAVSLLSWLTAITAGRMIGYW